MPEYRSPTESSQFNKHSQKQSDQLLLTQAYLLSTVSACKVGQNIYLGIIGLQVHNVLNIQHWGKRVGVHSIRDCNG